MGSGYLQGGDTYQILDADHWAGQTFRVPSSFLLQWVDLNLKLTNRQCEPRIYIFAASPAHLPVLPELSYSRYWLINQPLPTRDWLFHEPWGKSLSENHPWQENGFLFDSYTSFNNSQITIFNDAHGGENISHELPATLCPLVDPDGKHLYLHHHSPYASGSPTDAWFSYYLQTFKGAEEYLIEPLIDRGTLWGAWGTYASATATVYAFDHGKGPTILDITNAWIEGRTLAGLNNDPTDWYLKIIRIANEQWSTLSTQLLINNFLGIAHQQYTPVPDNDYDTLPPLYTWPNRLYRVRFSMSPFELNPASYYFMRVCAFPTWPATAQYWQYDKADSAYPSGIRLSSDNAGVDWTEHPSDDHLFSAFGTPISPPPPPDPPLPNWAVLKVDQFITPTGYKIVSYTNVPCHLYMFWTDIEPDKHERTKTVRGLVVADATAYCFVVWHQNEQAETGDTMIHTFIKEPWPVCETRWYTFRALVNNEWSPSAGPIFKKHRIEPQYGDPQWAIYDVYGEPSYWHAKDPNWNIIQTKFPAFFGLTLGVNAKAGGAPGFLHIMRAGFSFDTTLLPKDCYICSSFLRWYDHTVDWWLPNKGDYWVTIVDGNQWNGLPLGYWYAIFNSWTDTCIKFYVPLGMAPGCREYPLTSLGLERINKGGITRYVCMTTNDVDNIDPSPNIEQYYAALIQAICLAKLHVQYRPLLQPPL